MGRIDGRAASWVLGGGSLAALAAVLLASSTAPPARNPLLITAFEPFGERIETNRNASLEVLRQLRARHGNRFEYAVIPASAAGEARFRALLASGDYAGVIALGEDGRLPGQAVNLEPYAIAAPVSSRLRRTSPSERIGSPFARSAAAATGLPLRDGIGLYYCNRVYLHALRWTRPHGRPAVFVHIPIRGDRATHAWQVLAVAESAERQH